jgi:hypothetical protein
MIVHVDTVIVEASEAWPVVAASLGSAGIVAGITLLVARKQRESDKRVAREQREADSAGLDKQLAHDRDMRDLQHLRQTLGPIVAQALDWDAFISLHKGLATSGDRPVDEWKEIIAPLATKVADVSEQLRRGARTLVILAGIRAPVALRLREVANDGEALVHLAKRHAEAGVTTPGIQQELDALLEKYGDSHSRFIEAANEAVRWQEGST